MWKHLHKSVTMRFTAFVTFVSMYKEQIEGAIVRHFNFNAEDVAFILTMLIAIGSAGIAKGYVDSKNKPPLEER